MNGGGVCVWGGEGMGHCVSSAEVVTIVRSTLGVSEKCSYMVQILTPCNSTHGFYSNRYFTYL